MLLFATLVAGSFALGQRIANQIDPTALTALRFTIGAVAMLTISAATVGLKRIYLAAPWRYFAMGLCMALYFVLMFEGLKTASAVSTSAVFTLTPLFAAGFGWLLMRQITSPGIAIALVIGAIGALWVIFRADLAAFFAFDIGRGEAIFFFGVIAHALYAPLVPFLNRGEPTVVFTAGMLAAGSLLLWLVGGNAVISTDWASLPATTWAVIAYLSFVTTSLTFFLVQYAAMRLPASKVMAYTYFTPSVVILWDISLGAAAPPVALLGGVALTIAALLMLLRE